MGKLLRVNLDSFEFHGAVKQPVKIEDIRISPEFVRALLGGEWPSEDRTRGFCFDAIDHFRIVDGTLVPFAGFDEAPGPDFKLIMLPFLETPEMYLVHSFLDKLEDLKERMKKED